MKFEKINKDKIKVTLNIEDLDANNIDFHSFMSNSNSTNSLFLNVLEKAEKDYGFSTKDYNIKVETVALANGNFILTITRVSDSAPKTSVSTNKKKPRAKRIIPCATSSSVIYKFTSFDDFCNFVITIYNNKLINYNNISKDVILYNYQNAYYLVFLDINVKFKMFKNLFSIISEFGTYVNSSSVFIAKLHESASTVFKHKAIHNCIKYFVKKI